MVLRAILLSISFSSFGCAAMVAWSSKIFTNDAGHACELAGPARRETSKTAFSTVQACGGGWASVETWKIRLECSSRGAPPPPSNPRALACLVMRASSSLTS